jgi:hypothetical protein
VDQPVNNVPFEGSTKFDLAKVKRGQASASDCIWNFLTPSQIVLCNKHQPLGIHSTSTSSQVLMHAGVLQLQSRLPRPNQHLSGRLINHHS